MRALLAAVLALSTVHAAAADDFEAELNERLALYEAVRSDPSGIEAALAGRYDAYHEKLEAVVSDEGKTPVDHFVIGNMLYDIDPERSLAHHRAALAARPDEPLVWIEMAYQHHRRGECGQALPYYERVAERGRLNPPQYALMAHCLIRAGRQAEAVDAWRKTDHASRHTAVDFTIHDVFGEISPLARHDRLIKRVASGDRAAVGELLDNALVWQRDWWNGGTNQAALDAAQAAIERSFGRDASLIREVRVWRESLGASRAEELAALLEKEELILGEGRLPESSFVARKLLIAAAQHRLVSVAELAKRFTPEVERRARATQPDPDALFLLGAFVAESGDPDALREVDRYGWKRYRDADFAFSLIVAQRDALGDAFSHEDPLLVEALADFPQDPRFALFAALSANRAGAGTPGQIARLIDAEYHGLRSDDARYSYTLKGFYAELARRLPDVPAAPAD